MIILVISFINSRCCFYSVCYWAFVNSADCVLCFQMVTEEVVPMVGTVHQKKGAHTDLKHECVYKRREVTLPFVVDFWYIHGDQTSEVGVYISLFTSNFFFVMKGEA